MILGPRTNAVDFVSIPDLRSHSLFANLPYKFLEYHDRTVVRRRFKAGELVCRKGDYGSTAFLIIAGEFEIITEAPRKIVDPEPAREVQAAPTPPEPAEFDDWQPTWLRDSWDASETRAVDSLAASAPSLPGDDAIVRTPADIILGEMSCLSHHPRTASIMAWSDRCEMWEIRRNFLDALRRNRGSRAQLEEIYRDRAVPDLLHHAKLFTDLPRLEREKIFEILQKNVEFVRVDPGQIIFEQGQDADHFYLVRLGFVKVARKAGNGEFVLDYLGPNTQFGEIGLLTSVSVDYLAENGIDRRLPEGFARGKRTATVTALDDVELVRVKGEDFHKLARDHPAFRDLLLQKALEYLSKNEESMRHLDTESLAEATKQGLYHANQLLVLDLEKCTRCDECTKACADTHQGVSRLKRDGMRYGNFLVATSCRSCQNPYCMVGCPVDAIHRRPPTDKREGLEIVIEPWCIGCGRCEQNCPYGNISMHEYLEQKPPAKPEAAGPRARPSPKVRARLAIRKVLGWVLPGFRTRRRPVIRAVTCDLCRNIVHKEGQEVACVHACPHDAAHRMSGQTLIDLVREASRF